MLIAIHSVSLNAIEKYGRLSRIWQGSVCQITPQTIQYLEAEGIFADRVIAVLFVLAKNLAIRTNLMDDDHGDRSKENGKANIPERQLR